MPIIPKNNPPISVKIADPEGYLVGQRHDALEAGLTSVGTVTSGTWNADVISTTYGGTGLAAWTQGDIPYYTSGTVLTKLNKNTTATRYISNTGTNNAPAWAQVNVANGVTGTLPVANGGTNVTALGNLTKADDTNVTLTLGGTPTGALITSTSLTLGWTGTLAATRGGTGLSALGTGIATWLGTPSSANLASAVTDETGSGALVFATSPTFVTPLLGTPTSGTLTNCTGLPESAITDSTWTTEGGLGLTGFSGSPTVTGKYKVIGSLCYVFLTASGTSDATTFTITGLTNSSANTIYQNAGLVINNSGNTSTGAIAAISGTTVTMWLGDSASGWTNSGTKGLNGMLIIYEK